MYQWWGPDNSSATHACVHHNDLRMCMSHPSVHMPRAWWKRWFLCLLFLGSRSSVRFSGACHGFRIMLESRWNMWVSLLVLSDRSAGFSCLSVMKWPPAWNAEVTQRSALRRKWLGGARCRHGGFSRPSVEVGSVCTPREVCNT